MEMQMGLSSLGDGMIDVYIHPTVTALFNSTQLNLTQQLDVYAKDAVSSSTQTETTSELNSAQGSISLGKTTASMMNGCILELSWHSYPNIDYSCDSLVAAGHCSVAVDGIHDFQLIAPFLTHPDHCPTRNSTWQFPSLFALQIFDEQHSYLYLTNQHLQ
eukprot:gene6549-9390_t